LWYISSLTVDGENDPSLEDPSATEGVAGDKSDAAQD
jgi:hypothetical protein